MSIIHCNFHKKEIRHDIGCQVCWATKIHDPDIKTREECIILNHRLPKEKAS